jgi:glutaminyl-peptide cyclotransferase
MARKPSHPEGQKVAATRRTAFWLKVVSVIAAFAAFLLWRGCTALSPASNSNDGNSASQPHPAANAFDGQRAFDLLVQQVNFGHRIPDTEPSRQTQQLITQKLQEAGAQVLRQEFTVTYRGVTYRMVNVLGVLKGRSDRKVLLCAHYDTRPVADQDPNPANRNKPIPGANDGASGVAVLLEIARVLKTHQPPRTVVFAFFDGEDLGDVGDGGMFFGSKHFARNLTVNGVNLRAEMGVLLDMVGDRDFRSTDETFSRQFAPQVVDGILRAAKVLGYGGLFFQPPAMIIMDDHLPLNKAGIPTADIIDFDYPYWHTLQDTPDKCSAETLAIVGRTVLQWLMTL